MGAFRATAAAGLLILASAAASAADCITAVSLISSRSNVPNLVNGPMAWTGSVLAVAKTEEANSNSVWLGFYGEGMEPINHRLITASSREVYDIRWNGSEYGLFYRTEDQRLLLQRISPAGDAIGAPVAITPGRTVYSSDEVEIEWSAILDAWLVARVVSQGGEKGLYVTILERDGTERSDRRLPIVISAQSQLSMEVTPSGVIGVLFVNSLNNLAFGRLNATGAADVQTLAPPKGTSIRMTAHQEQFVIARAIEIAGRNEIHWFVLGTAHQLVRPDAVLIEPAGDDVFPLGLISNGSEVALAYADSLQREIVSDDTYRLRRFTINGTLIGDTRFAPDDIAAARAVTGRRFVGTGDFYISAPVRSSSAVLNSFLVKYCILRAEVIAPQKVTIGQEVTFTGQGVGGVPGYDYSWRFSNELRDDRGQVQERTYTELGTYTTTLTVTDDSDVVATTTFTFEVVLPVDPPKPRRRAVRR